MASDTGKRPTALWHLGRRVVWATRAEIGRAAEWHDIAGGELAFLCLQKGEPLRDARRGMEAGNPLCNDPSDLGGRQLAIRRQYPVAVLVEFADDSRPDIFSPIVELFFELVLDDGALFFDHKDLFEPLRKMANALSFEWP